MQDSKIEWTDHTFNPWYGCTKVSPACDKCYAELMMDTRYGKVEWGPKGARVRTSEANWKNPYKWNRHALKTYGRRARVFCASLADVCDNHMSIPQQWRVDLCRVIEETPNLQWMLLSKRPHLYKTLIIPHLSKEAISRTWFGATVESQKYVSRIPHLQKLRKFGAKTLFISAEPLLGPLKIKSYLGPKGINWAIVGGESGAGFRPLNLDNVRIIRDDCEDTGTAFLFKQHSGFKTKALGRLLDGQEWNEYPEAPIQLIKLK